MATNDAVQGNVGREYHTSQTTFLIKKITVADVAGGVGTVTVPVGMLPAGAVVRRAAAVPSVAFNAGTTNTVNIGNAALATAYGSALALGAIADVAGTISTAHLTTALPVAVSAVITLAGTVATAGAATVIVEYVTGSI
jgi:hypothetical protein